MYIEDYKPNSHKYKEKQKEENKKITKIANGKINKKSKNNLTKLFVSEDVENVKSYIFLDILVPTIKKAISEIITEGINMILYGESDKRTRSSTASKVSYRSYYDRNEDRVRTLNRSNNGYDYDDIILETRGEAEEVISRMEELIDMYGVVAVADLYDLVGVTGNYTDNKYGWTNINSAQAVRVRNGYIIKLPKPLPIN